MCSPTVLSHPGSVHVVSRVWPAARRWRAPIQHDGQRRLPRSSGSASGSSGWNGATLLDVASQRERWAGSTRGVASPAFFRLDGRVSPQTSHESAVLLLSARHSGSGHFHNAIGVVLFGFAALGAGKPTPEFARTSARHQSPFRSRRSAPRITVRSRATGTLKGLSGGWPLVFGVRVGAEARRGGLCSTEGGSIGGEGGGGGECGLEGTGVAGPLAP